MPYTNADQSELYKGLSKLKKGDFILTNSGLSTSNLTLSNIDNAAIRLATWSKYGHAFLYLGKNSLLSKKSKNKAHKGHPMALEMPLAFDQVRRIIKADSTNKIALVHCKKLTKAQRDKIDWFCYQYHAITKHDTLSYDANFVFKGAAAIAKTAIAKPIGSVVGLAHDKLGTQVADNIGDVMMAPATALGLLVNQVTKYPNLTCSGLVSYSHAAAGNKVVQRMLGMGHAATVTPDELWRAVQKSKSSFKITELDFND